MANVDEKVLAAVESALKKNPEASVDELYDMAKGISSGVGKLSKRQFHARYPLQIKRKMRPTKRRKPSKRKAASRRRGSPKTDGSARDAVRQSFLKFASELAAAEARKDVVKVLAGVDHYVDAVLKATNAS